MSDDKIGDGLARLVFLDFLTNDQKYNLGKADFYDFITYICAHINETETHFAFYDKLDHKLYITPSDLSNVDPILEVEFLIDGNAYRILTSVPQEEILDDPQAQKEMGHAAISVMNSMTSWETEQLPKFFVPEPGTTDILLFLSETKVEVTKEEKKLIENLLKRMAVSKNYYYEHCQNVAFELEFRATYPEDAPRIPDVNSEEDTEDDDPFAWI